MKALQDKMIVVRDLMMGGALPEGSPDLNEAECLFLAIHYNVRFKKTASGFIAFFSPRPGLSGMGECRIRAFIFMLNNLGFQHDPALNFPDQIDDFFSKLT